MLRLTNATTGEPIVIAARHFVAATIAKGAGGVKFTKIFTTSEEFLVRESLEEIGRQPAWTD